MIKHKIVRVLLTLLFIFFLLNQVQAQQNNINHWESVVLSNDTWKYWVATTVGPATNWNMPDFQDSDWSSGTGGIGYADNDDGTVISSTPTPLAVYIRRAFEIKDTSKIVSAILHMDYDDGFVAYLNGIEIARANLGTEGVPTPFNSFATDHEALNNNSLQPESFLLLKSKLKTCLKNGANVLAIQVNNATATSSDLSSNAWFSVGLTSSESAYRTVPSWFVNPYKDIPGSKLPLIMIRTNNQQIKADVKVTVDMGAIDNGQGNLNYPTDVWNNYSGKIGIEYRGSSSMMFPKKNMGFETRNADGTNANVALLGLPEENDWVLHGPYSDKTLIRNYLAYNLALSMGKYAPGTKMCEVYINDVYQGLYILVEKIKRDKNRVDIAKLEPKDVSGIGLTGGYIVKIDRSADGSYTDGFFSEYDGTGTGGGPRNKKVFYAWSYPDRADILPAQKDYITRKIRDFENVMVSWFYNDPKMGYTNVIDVSSFIDYWIMVEISKNTDGYRLSAFLHKDRDDRNPLIRMGPIWDYDLAFGNANYLEAGNTWGWNYLVPADGWGNPKWWSKLLNDVDFKNRLKCRWLELRRTILSNSSIASTIDQATSQVGDAATRNFAKWPIQGKYVWPNPYVGNSYTEDVNYMKNWMLQRISWIDSYLGGVCSTTGNEQLTSQIQVKAFPQPADGVVTLEVQNSSQEKVSIEVFGLNGQKVFSQLFPNDPLVSVQLQLRAGVYLAKISGAKETQTLKLIFR
ncbi:MAG TPA: hypothetical protein DCR40_16840 [Prolixibacteraceae bacterium]|nr:hypothetical protein [Prolixibacteraceae bacterium]